jgi:hypothetical protein
MSSRKALSIVFSIFIAFSLLGSSWIQGWAEEDCDLTISGYVFQGQVGDETRPLQDVRVSLYGSNAADFSPATSTLISEVTTNQAGFFLFFIYEDLYAYYFLVEVNPPQLLSVGATSPEGDVITADLIRLPSPEHYIDYEDNKFWDDRYLFSGNVYQGQVGDTSTPIASVPVSLYGAASPFPAEDSTLLASALTDASGAFFLPLSEDAYAYYFIIETNLEGYTSVGATSTYGVVINPDVIQFAQPLPCEQADAKHGHPPVRCEQIDGNNFWDDLAAPTFVFSGNVYQGQVGDTSTPLVGVTVNLIGSTIADPSAGLALGNALTDLSGAYSIELAEDAYPYYFLAETNLPGYISVGALTPGGTVINADTIQFTSPLAGVNLSGNDFWDDLAPPALEFSGFVYQGEVGDTSTPLAGVTVRLFGANLPYPVQNPALLDSAATGSNGAYTLALTQDIYAYYFIVEENLPGYISVGAQSVGGTVVTVDQIQFTAPVASQDRTGNNFWDNLTTADYVFSGHVYLGQPFDVTQPIGGINVRLYGKNTDTLEPIDEATLIAITQTNLDGSFNIPIDVDAFPFAYYFIAEQTPFGYFSSGAWTIGGNVQDNDTIRFASPLAGQNLSGNIFWDDISVCLVAFTGMVYEGQLNDVSNPLGGITVSLYGSTTPDLADAVLIERATTDTNGSYRIPILRDDYAFYFLVQQNLPGYISLGVRHYSGTTINPDVVRFESPLPGQNLSAIRFWDIPSTQAVTISGQVLLGAANADAAPMSGKVVSLYGSKNSGQGGMLLLDSDFTNEFGSYTLTYEADTYDQYLVVLQSASDSLQFDGLPAGALVTEANFYIPAPYRVFIPFAWKP